MKRVLVLGGNSFTGYRYLTTAGQQEVVRGLCRKAPVTSADLVELDLLDPEALAAAFDDFNPDVVLNAIAMGNVDQCERDPDEARRINVGLVQNLVALLVRRQARTLLIHLSSNAVYDGQRAPYLETSPAEPVNVYGKTKLEADRFIEENYNDHVILRPITMFGLREAFQRQNPASFILERLQSGQPVKLVDDVYGNLLYVDDLVDVARTASASEMRGTFNISGDRIVNRFEFGEILARVFGLEGSIQACSSDEFPSLAPRAPNTSFDNSKAKRDLGFRPTPIEDALRRMQDRLNLQRSTE